MTKQLSNHQDELFRIKEFLITNNPAKINDENKKDILTKFEQNFAYLIQYIKDGPVSYTHLDVYKRQFQVWTLPLSMWPKLERSSSSKPPCPP